MGVLSGEEQQAAPGGARCGAGARGQESAIRSEIERYKTEKKEIQAKAEALEAETKKYNELSEHAMHPHHRLAQATTMIQIAISLAAITVLTRKMWLFWGSIGAAAFGGVLFLLALAGR